MAIITTKPKGTQDLLPADSHKWQFVESVVTEEAKKSGFSMLRTPMFEHTELFLRGVGDTTDIVNKEMYTFLDKGDRSITLRPEGTAGALRAAIENGLVHEALPVRIYYLGPCFRYEKPQAGRFRQFHQFGVELLGPAGYAADCETMSLGVRILRRLGLQNVSLQINSIGCKNCRADYQAALVAYFDQHKDQLCETCIERLGKNPMRILDCKCPTCQALAKDAPTNLEYLCDDCKTEFEHVKSQLQALQIPYVINERIVRGLDYYTRTVFEFVTGELGAQSAVGGGGRYNGLVADLGGPDLPGVGFAMGMERLVMLMEKQSAPFPEKEVCEVCFIPMGEQAVQKSAVLAAGLREEGFAAEYDLMGRSVKAQMKYANRIGAKYTLVLGDNELAAGQANLKDMAGGEETAVPLTKEGLLEVLYQKNIDRMFGDIAEAAEQMNSQGE